MATPYELLLERIESTRSPTGVPWIVDGCGVTRRDTLIASVVHPDAYADTTERHRVLLVAGMGRAAGEAEASAQALSAYARSRRYRNRIALSAVPCVNPDGLNDGVGPNNGSGGNPSIGYPPRDGFFNDETDPESRYLWRYAGFMAPDCIVELRTGDEVRWEHSGPPAQVARALDATPLQEDGGLLHAMGSDVPNDLGQVPGLRLTSPADEAAEELESLWDALCALPGPANSEARLELARRRGRDGLVVAAKLATRYGDVLDPVVYTQGVALSGRLRFGALTGGQPFYARGIAELVEPYLTGAKPWFGNGGSGPAHAGLVWCDEMFEATGDERYRDILLATARRYWGNTPGEPPAPCEPDYRTEDMFFVGALIGRAFALSGDASYLDIQTKFLLKAGVQQDDGMFWHCRSVPFYWGRGNGFAALGFAETLTFLPEDYPDRSQLISMHKRHLDALWALQRPSGMLSQLLDFPGSYQELTATCMVGYALARGLRRGWLDDSYSEFAEGLWRAASERIGADGEVVDGCTGTGAVNDRRFYLDRAAEFGQDDRTGNLALWFAVEMARLLRGD